jgi:hypothetical protein
MASQALLPDDVRRYLESHPAQAEQLRKAEKVYRTFSEFLHLTQSRVVVRESGASTTEADLNATLLRTDI